MSKLILPASAMPPEAKPPEVAPGMQRTLEMLQFGVQHKTFVIVQRTDEVTKETSGPLLAVQIPHPISGDPMMFILAALIPQQMAEETKEDAQPTIVPQSGTKH